MNPDPNPSKIGVSYWREGPPPRILEDRQVLALVCDAGGNVWAEILYRMCLGLEWSKDDDEVVAWKPIGDPPDWVAAKPGWVHEG